MSEHLHISQRNKILCPFHFLENNVFGNYGQGCNSWQTAAIRLGGETAGWLIGVQTTFPGRKIRIGWVWHTSAFTWQNQYLRIYWGEKGELVICQDKMAKRPELLCCCSVRWEKKNPHWLKQTKWRKLRGRKGVWINSSVVTGPPSS